MKTTDVMFAIAAFFTFCSTMSNGFSMQPTIQRKSNNVVTSTSMYSSNGLGRRAFFSKVPLSFTSAAIGLGVASPPKAWSSVKVFKVGEKLSTEEAKARFVEAMAEVDDLIANYSEISKGGGDSVRRYLGTVGVEKKMYGITKVLKELREEADDVVEYTEASNEFEAYLYQAEGAAYQSLFVEHSSAKGTPESFLATAKKDVVNMRKFMGDLAEQLKL